MDGGGDVAGNGVERDGDGRLATGYTLERARQVVATLLDRLSNRARTLHFFWFGGFIL